MWRKHGANYLSHCQCLFWHYWNWRDWPGLKSLIQVERIGIQAALSINHYYISSFTSAAEFAQGIREHWGIENRLHVVKDVIFGEDVAPFSNYNAATNWSLIRTYQCSAYVWLWFSDQSWAFCPWHRQVIFLLEWILLRSVPTPTTHSVCAWEAAHVTIAKHESLAKCLMSVDLHKYLLPNKAFQPITSREGDFDTVSCIARGSWTPDCYADALSLKLVSFSINLKNCQICSIDRMW